MPNKRPVLVIVSLLTIIAALITIASYGVVLPRRILAPIEFNAPTAVDTSGGITAVADSNSRRLMILDGDDRLKSMIEYDTLSTPIEVVTDICVSDETIYVAGLKYEPDSDSIAQERVLAYDANGTFKGTVYEVAGLGGNTISIRSLQAEPDGIVVGVVAESLDNYGVSQGLQFNRIDDNDVTEIVTLDVELPNVFDCAYSTVADAYVYSTSYGLLEGSFGSLTSSQYASHIFSATDIANDGSVYAYDESAGTICRVTSDGSVRTVAAGGRLNFISINGQTLSFCNGVDNEIGMCGLDGTNARRLSETRPTMSLSLFYVLLMSCRIYLALLAFVLVARKVIHVVHTRDTHGMGGLFASLTVVIAVSIAIGYTSYKSYQDSVDTRLRTISTFADYFYLSDDGLTDKIVTDIDRSSYRTKLAEFDDQIAAGGTTEGSEVATSYMSLTARVASITSAASYNGIGTYTCIYGLDDDGMFYLYDSMSEHVFGASLSSEERDDVMACFELDSTVNINVMREGSVRQDKTQYRLVPLISSDRKSVPVVVEIGTRMRTFEAAVLNNLTERVASILVMMVVLYLGYSEARACGRCLLDYRDYVGVRDRDAIALLTRPFTFCVTAVSSVDSVMTVLISKQLVAALGVPSSSILVAIPSVMLGVGLALGHLLYGFVGSRVGPRRLAVRGSLVLALFAGCAIVAILQESFWLYCLAKLMLSIPLGTLYSFGYSLPRRANTREVRRPAQEAVTRTDTSAAAIGTVLGGYAAQILGSVFVYVLIAVMGILLALFVGHVYPRSMPPIERSHVRSFKETLSFLGSPMIMPIILFLMLPVVLAGGYDSFMFPLFSSDLGISTSAIHNISAFGKLIVYVSISQIGHLNERYDKWAISLVSVGLIGMTFLLFSYNTTLSWAIIVIAIVGVLSKCSDAWKALWLRSAEAQHFPRGRTTGFMFATRSILLMAQPLVLSTLLVAGERTAITILGGICILGAAIFWWTTKSSKLAPENVS